MNINHKEIDELVAKYKKNDDRAPTMELIIEKLAPYRSKFVNILKNGSADITDKDTKQFLKLFMPEGDIRKEMDNITISQEAKVKAAEIAIYIQKLCESIKNEDLEQDLIVLMFELINRYEPQRGVHFCGYLYNTYRYDVSRYVKKMTRDPMAFYIPYVLGDGEEYMDADLVPSAEEIFEEEMGMSWVNGITCHEIFLKLNKFQRIIIEFYYKFGYSDSKIAELLNSNRSFIYRQRIKAEEILKENKEIWKK